MNTEVMFSSKSSKYETPQLLFDKINEEFNFTLDVCADVNTFKCDKYFDEEIDGLSQDWSNDICWMNPPYDSCYEWIEKAHKECQKGATVVALVPARTDTKWFHNIVLANNYEVRFLKGRLKFGRMKNSAPFPSILIIFKN